MSAKSLMLDAAQPAPPEAALPRAALPEPFAGWFASRGWRPHAHQLALLHEVAAGRDALLIAPTGGGKTLAGFLPSLVDLAHRAPPKLKPASTIHTLYVSPLKALAVDIARNLATPIEEMGLPIKLETRTGDTPASAAPASGSCRRTFAHHARADRAHALPSGRCRAVRLAQMRDPR